MEIAEILRKIPKKLTEETRVNHSVQRFREQVFLGLLLFRPLNSERFTLAAHKAAFKEFAILKPQSLSA